MQNDQNSRSGLGLLSYIWNNWISTFIVLLLLLLTLIIGTGEMIHGQLLRTGEKLYGKKKKIAGRRKKGTTAPDNKI